MPSYQRRNLGLALAAAQVITGDLRAPAVEAAVASLLVPGRAQLLPGDPPAILDAAHNADGARALAEALPELLAPADRAVCVLAVLEGKDAEAIAAALAPHCARVVCTEVSESAIAAGGRPGGRSQPASRLTSLFAERGVGAEAEPSLEAAVGRASALAAELGLPLLVTGSHFLIGSALEVLGGRGG